MEKIKFRKKGIKKQPSAGITLIALVVTIIVLLILAGIAISMLTGNNGILNRSTEAKFANSIAQFDEQTKLASMSVRTSIEANKVSTPGYIATYNGTGVDDKNYFTGLVNEVAKELGVTALPISSSQSANIETEGYTVGYYLSQEGNKNTDGNGYIIIWYTDNSLRSSMDMNSLGQYGLEIISQLSADETENKKLIKNQATLVRVIHIQNYKTELSTIGITGTAGNVEEILNKLGGTESVQAQGEQAIENDTIVYIDEEYILRKSGKLCKYEKDSLSTEEYLETTSENLKDKVIVNNVKWINRYNNMGFYFITDEDKLFYMKDDIPELVCDKIEMISLTNDKLSFLTHPLGGDSYDGFYYISNGNLYHKFINSYFDYENGYWNQKEITVNLSKVTGTFGTSLYKGENNSIFDARGYHTNGRRKSS